VGRTPLVLTDGNHGLLRARSRFPEIVENTESVTEGIEQLEGAVELAKQMLLLLLQWVNAKTQKGLVKGVLLRHTAQQQVAIGGTSGNVAVGHEFLSLPNVFRKP